MAAAGFGSCLCSQCCSNSGTVHRVWHQVLPREHLLWPSSSLPHTMRYSVVPLPALCQHYGSICKSVGASAHPNIRSSNHMCNMDRATWFWGLSSNAQPLLRASATALSNRQPRLDYIWTSCARTVRLDSCRCTQICIGQESCAVHACSWL